ncbi:MAG: DUF3622 domain-containing protein [Pseudomonadota bacterium]
MAKGKKYDFRVKQENVCWIAEIIRKASSKKTVVSKRQSGFASESEAREWGQLELKVFLQNLYERNQHRSKQHAQESVAK